MLPSGWHPHEGQRAFLEAQAPIRVLACGRRWGKTEVVAVECWRALLTPAPRTVLLVAPSLDQATLAFLRVRDLLERNGITPQVRQTPTPSIRLNRSMLQVKSVAREGMYLRGRKAHLIIVDEAAYVPEAVVYEVLMPMLADTGGRLALVSTPRGQNYFYRLYQQGQSGDSSVWSLRSPSWANPMLSPATLRMQAQMMTARQYRVEYGAEFLDPAGQVFRTEWVDRALMPQPGTVYGMAVAGVDWARYRDWTAAVVLYGSREGAQMLGAKRWQGLAWTQQVQQVAQFLRGFGVQRVLCDRTGVGDPLVEALQHAGMPFAEGVAFTQGFKQSLVETLALMLEQGRLALLPEPTLLQELYHFEALPTPSGVRFTTSTGVHDDMVMALALAVWALPPAPAGEMIQTSGRGRFQ